MAGKNNLTKTTFSYKKLQTKANTSVAASDNQELVSTNIQLSAQTVFGQDIPSSPNKTLYTPQGAFVGQNTVEYAQFDLYPINASYYDANTYDSDASAQAAGYHAYYFAISGSYESLSNNPSKSTGNLVNGRHISGTLGNLQLVPPSFSGDAPNPYICTIYSGPNDVANEIPLTDEIDWYVDYYNGILFLQDYDAGKVPLRAKAFMYVGQMLSASIKLPDVLGTTVGWLGSGVGGISTTGSLFVGTSGASAAGSDIYLSNTGEARFNGQANNADFTVKSVNRPGALFIDADLDKVLILSGGAGASVDESSGTDVSFYVSGSVGAIEAGQRGVSVFGGDVVISGSLRDAQGNPIVGGGGSGGASNVGWTGPDAGTIHTTGSLEVGSSLGVTGSILPGGDKLYDLGGPANRFANIYTGDLHLRNERGNWTIVEEEDYLTVINNLTGKKYKMVLEPL